MNLVFLAALFFVILFSALLQLVLRCPYVVAAIVAVIALIVYAFFSATLTTIFIVWIIIYTLAALLTAILTCRFLGRNNNRCDRDGF